MGTMFKQAFTTITTFIAALELFAMAFKAFGTWAQQASETFADEAKDERELTSLIRRERIRKMRLKAEKEIEEEEAKLIEAA